MNHHGQEVARLSRTQSIKDESEPQIPWILTALYALLFSAPDTYLARFNDVFIDEYVHANHWHRFMSASFNDWKMSLSLAVPLLV